MKINIKRIIISFLTILLLFQIPGQGIGEYSISTEDNLNLVFREDGSIESLKIEGIEIIDHPSQVFYIRDLTPDYNIENLVYNPGFEIDDDNDGIADGWTPKTLQGSIDITLDNQNVYDGYKSLRMAAFSDDESSQMAYISTSINISGDEDYCISIEVMSDFGFLDEKWDMSIYIYTIFYDILENEIGRDEFQIHHTMYTWKHVSKIIHTPINVNSVKIMIVFTGPNTQSIPDIDSCTVWFDDIVFYKMPDKTKIKPITGTLKQQNDKLIYNSVFENLEFKTTYESKGEYIETNIEIKNKQREEKAMDLYFLLPIKNDNWIWWDDIRNHREIQNGIYEMTITADESSNLPLSIYPTSAITNKDIGLSIAIPLSKPRIFRIFYDTNLNKFGISFSLGLSPLTKFNTVNFTIYLYKCNAEWGFRSALDRYYKFFPQYFNKTIGPMFMNVSNPLADFGVRCIQGHYYYDNAARKLKYLNENNTYAFEYTLPNDYRAVSIQNTSDDTPDYEEFLGLLDFYVHDNDPFKSLKTMGAKNSTILDGNNDIIMSDIIKGPEWVPDKWVAGFPLNTDPELPGFNIADAMITAIIQTAFDNAEKYNARIDGVKMDGFIKSSRYIDMNTSRFCYADHPLTYSPNNFKPGISGITSMIEYIDFLAAWLEEHHPGTKLVGNCIEMGASSFGFPYLSAFPFEASSIYRWNFDEVNLNYRRSMAYHRPVMAHQTAKLYDEQGHILMEYLYKYVNMSMFYGIYPLMKGSFFNECNYETARPLYKKIIPIIDQLYLAGWEPITYARTDKDNVFVERFGGNTSVYFTIGNNYSNSQQYKLTVDLDKIGLEGDIHVVELTTNRNISFTYDDGILIFYDNIGAFGTHVFKISTEPIIIAEITKPKEGYLYVFDNPIAKIGETIVIGGITIETMVSGGSTDNVTFYIDDIPKYIDDTPPYTWYWNEFKFGKHIIKVIAGDNHEAKDEIDIIIFNI